MLKRRKQWPTGYTRKVFHFGIFISAAMLQAAGGTRAVCLFGAMTSLVILYAVLRGEGHMLYEAIAREKDAPHRTLYIAVPYAATLAGGVLSSIWFGPMAMTGFLVTGLGDAVGEPVGTRFGQHRYRVPSMRGVRCTRSLEGSFAVFIVSALSVLAAMYFTAGAGFNARVLVSAILIGVAAALCEAVSPHGWDNLTMQLVPTALAAFAAQGTHTW
ncbi:MAG: hypothetical protein IT364_10645 [Candidatus Hydrogenedentes bacterium]|nr:hypothetical protein [Candidatus Hydrogenedentota bacterium]